MNGKRCKNKTALYFNYFLSFYLKYFSSPVNLWYGKHYHTLLRGYREKTF